MKQASSVLLVIAYLLYSGKCQILLPPEMNETSWYPFPEDNEIPHRVDINVREVVPYDLDKDVIFQLYTRSHPTRYIALKPTEDADVGDFSNQRQTRFIIHGYLSRGDNMAHIRKAYLEAGDYNVIVVDWLSPAKGQYYTAKANMKLVGEYLASLIDFLVTHLGLRLEDVHIVGHSLGAHMAGVAGNRTKSGNPGRITGLDPAAPLFGKEIFQNRLDVSDAQFVEVIHTGAGRLGFELPMGHIDFYPNGGRTLQPGCTSDILGVNVLLDPVETLIGSCSHSRAIKYFAESITTTIGFVGYECPSWEDYEEGVCSENSKALMGEFTNTSSRGTYYLRTASSPPYALGDTSAPVCRVQKKLLH